MVRVKREDIVGNQVFISVFAKGIHKGFIEKSKLPHDELEYCKSVTWIKKQTRFFCEKCQMNHEVDPGNIICPARQIPVEEPELTEGFQILPNAKLPKLESKEYQVKSTESRKHIDPGSIEDKTVFFTLNQSEIELYESTGKIAVAPLEKLPDAFTREGYQELKNTIKNLVEERIKWEKLDSDGSDFQELTYQLLRLEDQFSNVTPGGTGPDQGKDGYCYQQIGRRNIKTMIQVKFNNNGSGLNKSDINSMVLDAESLGCNGLLVTTIKTTGNLETKLDNPDFVSQMQYLGVWEEVEMKSRISKYPSLVEKYF